MRYRDTSATTAARKRGVVMISYFGKISYFDSIKDAHIKTGLYESAICNCCRGKQVMCGGFRFKYKEDYENGRNFRNQ